MILSGESRRGDAILLKGTILPRNDHIVVDEIIVDIDQRDAGASHPGVLALVHFLREVEFLGRPGHRPFVKKPRAVGSIDLMLPSKRYVSGKGILPRALGRDTEPGIQPVHEGVSISVSVALARIVFCNILQPEQLISLLPDDLVDNDWFPRVFARTSFGYVKVAWVCPKAKLPILQKGIILIVVAVVGDVALKQHVLLLGAEFWIGVEIVEYNSNAVWKGRIIDYAISEGLEKELQWDQVVHGAARDDHKVIAKPI